MKMIESQTPPRPQAVSGAEERYQVAKVRLLAARREKMEAADDFLAARAALRGGLKTAPAAAGWTTESGPPERLTAWAEA